MSKLFLFFLLTYIFGNPFIALLVILVLVYLLDRQFVGLFPSLFSPWRKYRQIQAMKREIELNPHHVRNKLDLGILLLEKKKYREALIYLEPAAERLDDQAEAQYAYGLALLKSGAHEKGLEQIQRALDMNPRIRYGEPYLVLASFYQTRQQTESAMKYLTQFQQVNSSSSEAHYRLGEIYREVGEREQAIRAYNEAVINYRTSPKFRRKTERRWAILAWFRRSFFV
jgi:tetratricopeptide (TPR) repeat protein